MAVDVAARRRVAIDRVTVPATFTATRSTGGESGLEPAEGTALDANGGNAFPVVSGTPGLAVSLEIVCAYGGAVSKPLYDGGAWFRYRLHGEADSQWRGNAWPATCRVGYTTSTVARKVVNGSALGWYVRTSGVSLPSGRLLIAGERRSNSGAPANYAVDVCAANPGAPWTIVQAVPGGTGPRAPAIVRRADGRLILYYLAINAALTGFQLSSSFSTDNGATWSVLAPRASDVDTFPADASTLSVVEADGYFAAMVGNTAGTIYHYLYSVDGGVSFRQIRTQTPTLGAKFPRLLALLDDSVLVVWGRSNGTIQSTVLACGLDYPDFNATTGIIQLANYGAGSSVGQIEAWLGNDGTPHVVAENRTILPSVWPVFRGTRDGSSWIAAASGASPGLIQVHPSSTTVQVLSGSVSVVQYRGTFGVAWSNDGVATASIYPVEDRSLNWTIGAGNENIGVTWDWQHVWPIAAGTPSGLGIGFVGTAGQVSRLPLIDALALLGTGNTAYWETDGTLTPTTNATRTAVATLRTFVGNVTKPLPTTSARRCALVVRGSTGTASGRMTLCLYADRWELFTGTNVLLSAMVASGLRDNTRWTEWLLGTTYASATEQTYALVARFLDRTDGDSVWERLALGTSTDGISTVATGYVAFGSLDPLPAGQAYAMIPVSMAYSKATTAWAFGNGDSLFTSGPSALGFGPTLCAIPQQLVDDVWVSFSGDVAAAGDSYSAGTRYQYAWENLSPNERGEWRSAADLANHSVVLDLGTTPGLVAYDLVALWGTNFREARVSFDDDPAFPTPTSEAMYANVATYGADSIPIPAGSTLSRSVTIHSSNDPWKHDQWVGYYFVWTTGTRAEVAGRVESNSEYTLTVTLRDGVPGWDSGMTGRTFELYADRMFAARPSARVTQRYVRISVNSQGTPDGFYRGKGFTLARSHRFSTNWEWEQPDGRVARNETVESPGGERYVYELGPDRREVEVEWTGAQDDVDRELFGLWRAAEAGRRVVCVVLDVYGGPLALLPARVVGDFRKTTQALYVESASDSATPILQVVDVSALTFSEEI